jgi:hypothetical protein
MELALNYWAILAAAATNYVLGYIWYSPLMFENLWLKLIGKTKDQMKPTVFIITTSFVGSFILSFVLAYFINYAQADTVLAGSAAAFLLWLGFVASTSLNQVLFEERSINLFIINNGYYLISMLIMGSILAVWR